MTNPAHFTDRVWAAKEAQRQAREAHASGGRLSTYWEARGATLVRDGRDVAYIMRIRREMTLNEAKALCSVIADALNTSPSDGAAANSTKVRTP